MARRREPAATPDALEARAAAVAARQGGAIGFAQLRALGLSSTTIDRWVRRGVLHREHEGVFGLGRPVDGQAGEAWAAVLALGARATASHATAACLHGLRPWRPGVRAHVTVPRRGGFAQPRITVHRVRRLRETDVVVLDGLRCTSVARTLLDEAERVPLTALRRLVREAAVRRALDPVAVHDLLEHRAHGRRGQRPLRAVLASVVPDLARTASDSEALLLRLCAEGGLPRPGVNVLLRGHERAWRADAVWLAERVVVEVDSWRYHGFSGAFEDDHHKDEDLRAVGFAVLRFTASRLEAAPDRVIGAIARELQAGRRAAEGRRSPTPAGAVGRPKPEGWASVDPGPGARQPSPGVGRLVPEGWA